jgi:hypothetical protein
MLLVLRKENQMKIFMLTIKLGNLRADIAHFDTLEDAVKVARKTMLCWEPQVTDVAGNTVWKSSLLD